MISYDYQLFVISTPKIYNQREDERGGSMEEEREELEVSLRACGFEEQAAEQYIQYAGQHFTAGQLRLLNSQRKKLMDCLHAAQRRVDTVDFMIRSVEGAAEENRPGILKRKADRKGASI